MATNAENARIYGSDLDAIYLAPIGTPLPEGIDDELDAAFEDIGWLSEDGITETATGSADKKRGYQGSGVVRTIITEPGTTVSFVALEEKPMTDELRYYQKSSTTSGGVRRATRSPGQRVSRRACVIDKYDVDDTSRKTRDIIEVLEITPNGDKVATSTDISVYPFVGEIIGDYEHLATEEPAGSEEEV